MNGFEKRSNEKKQNILKVANELFKTHGVKKTTVDDIALQAKVSKATIFKYFNNKNNLIQDVIVMEMRKVITDTTNIMENNKITFDEKIMQIIKTKTFYLTNNTTDYYDFMANFLNDNNFIQKYDFSKKMDDIYVMLYEQGINSKYINSNITFATFKVYFSILSQGSANPYILDYIKNNMEQMCNIIMYGFLNKPI